MPAKLPFCVYVLRSDKDNHFYIGFTTDLKQRLTAHVHGEVASTLSRRPLRLVLCEDRGSGEDARRREGYARTPAGRKALRPGLRDVLAGTDRP